MRGLYTAGALDVLMECGIEFDGVIGVSAGATFGVNYNSKQIDRAHRYNIRFAQNWRYGTMKSLRKSGDLYDVDFCYRELPYELDKWDMDTFYSNPVPFYCVCTTVDKAEPLYHLLNNRETDMNYIRASASLPVFSKPVYVEGQRLLDGGIADPIPLRFMEKQGYTKNLVILTQPLGYQKKKAQWWLFPFLKKLPAIYKAMKNRHTLYNGELSYVKKQEEEGNAFVLRPSKDYRIKHTEHDTARLEMQYQLGRADMEAALPQLLGFLNRN